MIVLYAYIAQSQHQHLIDKYGDLFTDRFKAKILKYKRWQDAQLSLLGRVILTYGLHQYYQISEFEIGYSAANKPFLVNEHIHFNISHAKNIVVCCIADLSIGIDIEYIDYHLDVANFSAQMTENECFQINNSKDKHHDFFTIWTQKEALIKADGRGFLLPPASFEIVDNQARVDHQQFYLTEMNIHTQYKCYLCSDKPIVQKEVQLVHFDVDMLP